MNPIVYLATPIIPMKVIFLSLTFVLISQLSVSAQSLATYEQSCNYKALLEYYQKQDSLGRVRDSQVLFKMAQLASNIDRPNLSKNYLERIVSNESENSTQIVDYKAKLYLNFAYEVSLDIDSLKLEVIKNLGETHELLSVIDLIETSKGFKMKKNLNLDSIVTEAISKIDYVEGYKRIIAISLQQVSIDYADKGKFLKGIHAAKRFEDFVRKHYAPCSEEISTALITRGRRYLDADQLDSAAYYIKQSYALSKQYHAEGYDALSKAAINLSEVVKRQGYFDEAIELLEEAKATVIEDSTVADKMLPVIYNNIGGIYKSIGSYKKAIEYYQRSILFSEKKSSEPSVNKIAAYYNTGNQFYAMEEYDLSEQYRQKALEITKNLLGEKHRFTAMILMSLGSIEYKRKNYETCRAYFDQSLNIRKEIYGDQHPSLANIYFNYAYLYLDQKMYDQAKKYSEQVLDIYKNHYGPNDPKVAEALLRLASIEYDSGNYLASKKLTEESKKLLINKGGYKGSTNSLLYLDVVSNAAIVAYADLKQNKRGNLDTILGEFAHSTEVFDYHVTMNEEISDISGYANDYPDLFSYYTDALVLKSEQVNIEQISKESYRVNDKGKSLGLFKSLDQRYKMMFAQVPMPLRTELKKLKSNIRVVEQSLSRVDAIQSDDYQLLLDSLNLMRHKLQMANTTIKDKYPAFDRLNNTEAQLDIEKLIPPTGSSHAIIDYRLVDSTLICFSLFDGKIKSRRISLPATIEEDFRALIQKIAKRASLDELDLFNDVLVKPLLELPDFVNQLVIISDDYFSSFPFEILSYDEAFLVNRFAISYANSARILDIQNQIKSISVNNNFAGFAPRYRENVDTSNSNLYADLVRSGQWELPFAEDEVNFIAELLEGETFIGDSANKENFFEALKHSKVVYLSMHAKADNERPMNSQFIFNTSNEEEEQNLLLYELYNLQANADLVVLSACETGVGEFHNGDGVRSLGNGFLYAGVPSVIMSLWKVPDASTSKIMKSFHQHLKAGKNKSAALRLAKLDYLNTVVAPEQKHPFYWAGFVLSGNDDPIDFNAKGSFPSALKFSLFSLLLLGIGWWWKKSQ